ncbi:hypothetical protein SeMB42_g00214 [Synchytrium endobioticum]|nr:hypothetical protein SeMB42_g00214 [Synchytrium endobioticum]
METVGKLIIHGIKFQWKIDDFVSHAGTIYSPSFFVQDRKFKLVLDPNFRNDEDTFVSVYVEQMPVQKQLKGCLFLYLAISVKDERGEASVSLDGTNHFREALDVGGFENFLPLKNALELLKDGAFVLDVSVEPVSSFASPPPFQTLYLKKRFSDIDVVAKDNENDVEVLLPAHTLVLRMASKVLEQAVSNDPLSQQTTNDMPSSSTSESTSLRPHLVMHYSPEVCKRLCAFVYGLEGRHWLPTGNNQYDLRMKLLAASDYYDLDDLYEPLVEVISQKDITKDTILDILTISDHYPRFDHSFKETCIKYFVDYGADIVKGQPYMNWCRDPKNSNLLGELVRASFTRK